nr:glycosyltransferase [Halorhodospira halophila]
MTPKGNEMESNPFVSVIIPTYRDEKRLQKCLDALQNQTYPAEDFEIIIVDNDEKENNHFSIKLPDNAVLKKETTPGSYIARNTGIKHAGGQVFAFTDSDCVPDPEWLQNSVICLAKGNDRIAGRIVLFCTSKKRTIAEAYEILFSFNQKIMAKSGKSVTANMACWRYCFDYVGEFDATLFSGGDTEWSHRASGAGLNIVYAPHAIVKHPARKSLKDLLIKRKRTAGSFPITSKTTRQPVFLLKGFMPPFWEWRTIVYSKKITLYEKIALIPISYFLKIYNTCVKIAIIRGWTNPSRY